MKSIAVGSAADVSHKICINDQIIEVDGKSLYGHTNHQAVEVLRQSGSRVHLRLARYLRGAKFNQLQQLVASADVGAPVTPHPSEAGNSSITSFPGSTLIQLEGIADRHMPPVVSHHDVDSDSDLPPPPHFGLLPSLPQSTTVTVNSGREEHRNLREKWSQRVGPDFLIVVSLLLTCIPEK